MGRFDFFRKKKVTTGSREAAQTCEPDHATEHCFVLCRAAEPDGLLRRIEVVEKVFGRGYSVEIDDDNIIVTVKHANEAVGFLVRAPFPIPTGEAEKCADQNFLWLNGKDEAAKHQSHVIVTSIGSDEQTPVQSAIMVSRLALVALNLFDAIGVYWGNASVCNSRKVFEGFCENMSEEHVPVPMWVRLQVVRASDDEIGMYTLGMDQFGLMDIEVDRCRMNLKQLAAFVGDMAHYLIQRGPVINDGDTAGESDEERVLIRHCPSMIDENRDVYKIVFDE